MGLKPAERARRGASRGACRVALLGPSACLTGRPLALARGTRVADSGLPALPSRPCLCLAAVEGAVGVGLHLAAAAACRFAESRWADGVWLRLEVCDLRPDLPRLAALLSPSADAKFGLLSCRTRQLSGIVPQGNSIQTRLCLSSSAACWRSGQSSPAGKQQWEVSGVRFFSAGSLVPEVPGHGRGPSEQTHRTRPCLSSVITREGTYRAV